MDLLSAGAALDAIKGKGRLSLLDHRPPLSSPMTLVALLLQAIGFRWYGAEKELPNGETGTSCFLDTCVKYEDGSEARRVVWNFTAGDRVEIGGDPVSLVQVARFFGYSQFAPEVEMPRGAQEVFRAMLIDNKALWRDDMPFNARGQLLLNAANSITNAEAKQILGTLLYLYRGYVWKLSTPQDHPPHPEYGYPLERHLRYKKGKRIGDVRKSIHLDQRMEELRSLGLR